MKRHALFAGVNSYDDKTIRSLRFSIPDASVLADRFKQLGFSTTLLSDPTGAELKQAVRQTSRGLGPGDVYPFFFAGHGFTAQDGTHLLFCRDDQQELLRCNSAYRKQSGYGRFTWADGTSHEGEWANDKQDGPGVTTCPDGTIIRGIFSKGKLIKREGSGGIDIKTFDSMMYGSSGEKGGDRHDPSSGWRVLLVDVPVDRTIAVVKELRGLFGLGLADSKKLAESTGVIRSDLSKQEAERIAGRHRRAGAEVRILAPS